MIKQIKWIPVLVLVAVLLLAVKFGAAQIQSSTHFNIKKDVVDQGGASSQSPQYALVDAIGQPGSIGKRTSNSYQLSSGYLSGGAKSVATTINNDYAESMDLPTEFELMQNYPNPFNLETIIQYELPQKSKIKLAIFNLSGQHVATIVDKEQSTGSYTVKWAGTDSRGSQLPSGLYLYKIFSERYARTKKMLMIR